MAVTLRLARHGDKKRPHYRIVAADSQKKRDGRFVEVVGSYQPTYNPAKVVFKEDLVKKWLDLGALPTMKVRDLIKKSFPGLVEGKEEHRANKVKTARRNRKERAAKQGKKKK